MKKHIIISLLGIFILGCNSNEVLQNKENTTTVALLDNSTIFLNEVDSFLGMRLFELRLEAFHSILDKKLLASEALKRGLSVPELIKIEESKNSKKITATQISKYISDNRITEVDSNQIFDYLTFVNQKEQIVSYTNSLKQKHEIKVKLQPPFYKQFISDKLYYHDLTEGDEIVVYIISDFKCPNCQKAEKELKNIYRDYGKKVNFRFVYYSSYIGKDALASEAAFSQGKFKEMHDLIFVNSTKLHNDSIYFNFSNELGLDSAQFSQDFNKDETIKLLIKNKAELRNAKIYSTPIFIVNGNILDGKYAIDYIEDVIKKELNEK